MKKITEDWLESAKMDLDNIELIITRESLTPVMSFHAQQAVEKSLKAYLEEKGIQFRKIHDLVTLYGLLENELPQLDKNILERLNGLYIDSRYPGELGLLPEGRPSLEDVREFYEFAKYVYETVIKYLDQNCDSGR